jgi:hypothetical protein
MRFALCLLLCFVPVVCQANALLTDHGYVAIVPVTKLTGIAKEKLKDDSGAVYEMYSVYDRYTGVRLSSFATVEAAMLYIKAIDPSVQKDHK